MTIRLTPTLPSSATKRLTPDSARAAAYNAGYAEGRTEGRQAGAAAATARIAAILTSPEAVGRKELARHLALKSGLSTADALASLTAAPRGESGNGSPFGGMSDFDRAMGVGAGIHGGAGHDERSDADPSDVLALVRAAGMGAFHGGAKR